MEKGKILKCRRKLKIGRCNNKFISLKKSTICPKCLKEIHDFSEKRRIAIYRKKIKPKWCILKVYKKSPWATLIGRYFSREEAERILDLMKGSKKDLRIMKGGVVRWRQMKSKEHKKIRALL